MSLYVHYTTSMSLYVQNATAVSLYAPVHCHSGPRGELEVGVLSDVVSIRSVEGGHYHPYAGARSARWTPLSARNRHSDIFKKKKVKNKRKKKEKIRERKVYGAHSRYQRAMTFPHLSDAGAALLAGHRCLHTTDSQSFALSGRGRKSMVHSTRMYKVPQYFRCSRLSTRYIIPYALPAPSKNAPRGCNPFIAKGMLLSWGEGPPPAPFPPQVLNARWCAPT